MVQIFGSGNILLLCFSTVLKWTVPVLVPGNSSGGSGSAFGSWKNGSDGSGSGSTLAPP